MKRIDFWLDFASPYAYLAFERLPRALEGLSYEVVYRPVLLADLREHHGQPGPAQTGPERDWVRRHALWLAHTHGTALDWPAAHPFDPLPLSRLAWACARQGAPSRWVCETLFHHAWQGGGADDPARLRALTARLTPVRDPADAAVAQQLRDATDAALARGVFGVPTLAVGERLFWGLDALPMLRACLQGDAWLDAMWAQGAQAPSGTPRH